ncbi:MAG: hypothetical protein DDT24_00649 [Chloroflexi bacterium]|nr:hypothetical protein [Chloroflexota bacterium]
MSGRKIIERYIPPGGDAQVLPILPRPPVCVSAMTAVPSLAPCAARALAASCVEATSR